MAKRTLSNQKVWLGGFDLSGVLGELAFDYGAETRDAATLADKTRVQLAGLKTVSASHAGIWDSAGGLDQALFNQISLFDAPMSFAPTDAAEGDLAYSFLTLMAEYTPIGGELGEPQEFTLAAQSGGPDGLIRDTLMHNATRIVSANGNGQQLGAVATGQKLFGALHVIAASGTLPTLDVTVESDDNPGFTTPVTRMTFAQQTAIGFEWALPIAGPITDDWWRIVWAITGTTPSFTFVSFLGIQ